MLAIMFSPVLPQVTIFGDGEVQPNKENAVLLSMECCKHDLPTLIAQKLSLLNFESRKDAAQVTPTEPGSLGKQH